MPASGAWSGGEFPSTIRLALAVGPSRLIGRVNKEQPAFFSLNDRVPRLFVVVETGAQVVSFRRFGRRVRI